MQARRTVLPGLTSVEHQAQVATHQEAAAHSSGIYRDMVPTDQAHPISPKANLVKADFGWCWINRASQ